MKLNRHFLPAFVAKCYNVFLNTIKAKFFKNNNFSYLSKVFMSHIPFSSSPIPYVKVNRKGVPRLNTFKYLFNH